MKFIVIFAAVLLTVNAAKVPPMSEETAPDVQVPTTQPHPVEEVAAVSEIPNHHVVSTEVTPIVSTTVMESVVPVDDVGVQLGIGKVPLTHNPQVTVTSLTPVFEVNNHPKMPAVETPMLAELSDPIVTTESPVDSTEVTTIVAEEKTKNANDPSPCDLQCTKLDLNPVCAINLDCIHEFPNYCVMETYNCLHPNKAFKEVKDERCKMHWLKKCTEKEMMED